MASLGELTAGIAHEIQNPLNFVNNFSEVSVELAKELQAELGKSNPDKLLLDEILSDISSNMEKIVHHGNRASGIVKNMLAHSRQSSGEKTATDLNALLSETLNLAYHSFRAKDKSFNIKLETIFDAALPKATVASQEISRVFLNIIQNGFYATSQKRREASGDYSPTFCVSTSLKNQKIFIQFRDNGGGIPESIIAKIFQPFFTTKKGAEGTGLGLSISYDIIRAHGGEISVRSVEGKETEFEIVLPAISLTKESWATPSHLSLSKFFLDKLWNFSYVSPINLVWFPKSEPLKKLLQPCQSAFFIAQTKTK